MISSEPLPLEQNFVVGIDAGGTKIHVLDTLSDRLHRFNTKDYQGLTELLVSYFAEAGRQPVHVTVAMAGARDSVTGIVRATNCPWPPFDPHEAALRFPGTTFTTANDMVAAMAGVLESSSMNRIQLKPGHIMEKGTKVTVTISTGVNACAAIWDEHTRRHVFLEAEAGHMGFQPNTEEQDRHLKHLRSQFQYPSAELAIGGKYGMESWVEHSPEMTDAPELMRAIKEARDKDTPVGAVIYAYATVSKGASRNAAQSILDNMGSLAANILADYALVYKATGGIFLVGSIAQNFGEYWSEHTSFVREFIRLGSKDHAPWLEDFFTGIPIYLNTDPNVVVNGAFYLAKAERALLLRK